MKKKQKETTKVNEKTALSQKDKLIMRLVIWITIPVSLLTSYILYYSSFGVADNDFVNELHFHQIDVFLVLILLLTLVFSMFRLRIKKRFLFEIQKFEKETRDVKLRKYGLEIRFYSVLILYIIYVVITRVDPNSIILTVYDMVFYGVIYSCVGTYLASRFMMLPLRTLLNAKKYTVIKLAIGMSVLIFGGTVLFLPTGGEASNFIYLFGEVESVRVEDVSSLEFGVGLSDEFDAVVTYSNGEYRTISSDKLTILEYNAFNLNNEYVAFEYRDYRGGFTIHFDTEDIYVIDSDYKISILNEPSELTTLYIDLSNTYTSNELIVPEQYKEIYLVGVNPSNTINIELLNPNFKMVVAEANMTGEINSFGTGNKTIEFHYFNHIAGAMRIDGALTIDVKENAVATIRGIYEKTTLIGDVITVTGHGTLNVYGSHGLNGENGIESDKNGTNGTDGQTAILAKQQLILNAWFIEFSGGSGGHGGDGYSYPSIDGTTTSKSAGDGGDGGKGAIAMETCNVAWAYEPMIFNGMGGRAGTAGNKGNAVSIDGTDGESGILANLKYKPGTSFCN